jgi:hypothetical protein
VLVLECRRCGHQRRMTAELVQNLALAARRTDSAAMRGVRCLRSSTNPASEPLTRRGKQKCVQAEIANLPGVCGDGGPDSRCWKCWGRGFLDSGTDDAV